jgi:hypothetical protein
VRLLKPDGLVEKVNILGPFWTSHQYDSLLQYLHSFGYVDNKMLFVFAYDWRVSNFETAARLKAFVDGNPALRDGKFDLLSHSRGGNRFKDMDVGIWGCQQGPQSDLYGYSISREYERLRNPVRRLGRFHKSTGSPFIPCAVLASANLRRLLSSGISIEIHAHRRARSRDLASARLGTIGVCRRGPAGRRIRAWAVESQTCRRTNAPDGPQRRTGFDDRRFLRYASLSLCAE